MKNIKQKSLNLHKKIEGKLETKLKINTIDRETLSLLYSPGVSYPCAEIKENKDNLYLYTIKKNTVAIITNGTAVLGMGNIGANASLPVMEGKAMLLKYMSGLNSFPICIDEQDPDRFIEIVEKISTSFGAINLEDIKAPECTYIESTLQKKLNIPVFHDDQHGTAIVVLAALINALRLAKKSKEKIKVVISGSGSAGSAICKLLFAYGIKKIIILNKHGVIKEKLVTNNSLDEELSKITLGKYIKGKTLEESIDKADVFIGVSVGNIFHKKYITLMNDKPIIFALANPTPEISFEDAKSTGCFIYGSGRSDYHNQINNLLAFPGIFKYCFSKNIKIIDKNLKIKIANKIADYQFKKGINPDEIIPYSLDQKIVDVICE